MGNDERIWNDQASSSHAQKDPPLVLDLFIWGPWCCWGSLLQLNWFNFRYWCSPVCPIITEYIYIHINIIYIYISMILCLVLYPKNSGWTRFILAAEVFQGPRAHQHSHPGEWSVAVTRGDSQGGWASNSMTFPLLNSQRLCKISMFMGNSTINGNFSRLCWFNRGCNMV
jgi:hypothetical protein